MTFDQLLVITTLWWESSGLTLSSSEAVLGTYEVPEQSEPTVEQTPMESDEEQGPVELSS